MTADKPLPDIWRRKHIQMVKLHNLMVLGAGVVWFAALFAVLQNTAALLGLAGLFLIFLVFLSERVDDLVARRIGFVCPTCGKSLYVAQSVYWRRVPIEATNRCPHCSAELA